MISNLGCLHVDVCVHDFNSWMYVCTLWAGSANVLTLVSQSPYGAHVHVLKLRILIILIN